jgi:hypothetical protein
MHDEENRLGIHVSTPSKDASWYSFGDSHLFDSADSQNLQQCLLALQQSVKEVHDAYQSRVSIPQTDYQAFDFAATLESIVSRNHNFAPLFQVVDGRVYERKDTSITVDKTDRQALSNDNMWSGYKPVVSRFSPSS